MKNVHGNTVCARNGVDPVVPDGGSKIGLALSTLGRLPINGFRHRPEKGTNGWYIWCGEEFSEDPDFFSPLHVEHLPKYLPEFVKYLDLPPGYRVLTDASGYEDVWLDESLLDV